MARKLIYKITNAKMYVWRKYCHKIKCFPSIIPLKFIVFYLSNTKLILIQLSSIFSAIVKIERKVSSTFKCSRPTLSSCCPAVQTPSFNYIKTQYYVERIQIKKLHTFYADTFQDLITTQLSLEKPNRTNRPNWVSKFYGE